MVLDGFYMKHAFFSVYKAIVRLLWNTGIGNQWPFEMIHYKIISWLRPSHIHLDGHRILLDSTDGCRLSYASQKTHGFEKEFLMEHIRTGDVILDIGANIGYYTLLFARAVGPNGHVFAFEPDPSNLQLLQRNISNNGYGNVTICPVAVSDTCGPHRLYKSRTHGGTHRIYTSTACAGYIEINSTSLDKWYESYGGRISLIKMDIEGAEPLAIRSAAALIRRNPQAILFTEFYPTALREAGTDPQTYLDQLALLGFRVYQVDQKTQQVRPATIGSLLKQCPLGSNLVTNLWCTRAASEYLSAP